MPDMAGVSRGVARIPTTQPWSRILLAWACPGRDPAGVLVRGVNGWVAVLAAIQGSTSQGGTGKILGLAVGSARRARAGPCRLERIVSLK